MGLRSLIVLLIIWGCSGSSSKDNSVNEAVSDTKLEKDVKSQDEDLQSLLSPEDTLESSDENNTSFKVNGKKDISSYTVLDTGYKASPCEKCDFTKLTTIRANLDSLSYQNIYNLLCTLDKSCLDNAEFSELGNEMLYLVLSHYTSVLLRILESEDLLSQDHIIDEIRYPLSDYNYDGIIRKLDTIQVGDQIKSNIISALEEARGSD